MPSALAAAVATSFAGIGAGTAALIYSATYITSLAAMASIGKRVAKGLAPRSPGLEVAVTDSAADGRIIYGTVKTSGVHVIPALTSGSDGQHLHMVLALAAHEVSSFGSVYLDDDEIASGDIAAVSGGSGDGLVSGSTKYAGHAWLRRYAGTSTQNVDYILNAAFPSSITSSFRGRGIAYIAGTFNWGGGKVYEGGVPNVTVVVNGKKCYDPRLDSSPGANPTNPAYAAHTSCPALHWADFKTNAVYGQGVASSLIDWDDVVTAANTCDATVAVPTASTQPRYTFNGVLSTGDDLRENERVIIDAMLGKVAFTGGKWRVKAGAWVAPEFSIGQSDWVSIGAIQAVSGRTERYNGVIVYHTNSAKEWQRVEAYRRTNATYTAADAGERNWLEAEQPYCLNAYEAQRKGEMLLRQSRNGIRLTGTLLPRFMGLRTWDNVSVTFEDLGWSAKTFTVTSCLPRSDGAVDVSLVEEQEADWTDMAEGDYNQPSSAAIPATNPTSPSAPSSFSVLPLLGTLQFDFGDPVVKPRGTLYQIVRSVGTLAAVGSTSVSTVLWEGNVTRILLPGDVRSYYWYHGRAVTNSYASPLLPNTFGTGSAPYITAESAPGNRSYPDGELIYASNSYWMFVDSGAAVGVPSSYAFFTGSGFTNQRGYIRLYINSHNNGIGKTYLLPMRVDVNSRFATSAVPFMQGQRGVAYLSARGVGSSSMPIVVFGVYGVRVESPGTIPQLSLVTYANTDVDHRAVASGEWRTYVATFTSVTSQYDGVAVAVTLPAAHGGPTATLDIGAMQLSVF